jgi:hypothetical protein
MSFDLHLRHFAGGDSAPVDPGPVARVLARERHRGPDEFGFYLVEFADGASVEFNARGLGGREPFDGCAFHLRGISPQLIEFVFDVARAGDFVLFNAQGDDSDESPVVITVGPDQAAHLPPELAEQYKGRPVCASAEKLGAMLLPGFAGWEAYRNQVMKGYQAADSGRRQGSGGA